MQPKTGQEIITMFELFMDDTTELSSTEELSLLNKVYNQVCSNRPWEFLKTSFTDTTSGDYVTLPSNFQYLTVNSSYSDSSVEAGKPVVFVGASYSPFQVVSWSDRRQYRDRSGYCYVDIANGRLYFTKTPEAGLAVEFDYIKTPEALTLATSPVFPARFHDMLYHGMCVEDNIIQQSEKARSYAPENQQKYKSYFDDLCYWNSNLIQM